MTATDSALSESTGDLPLLQGGAAGAGAYLVGYVLVYALAGSRIENSTLEAVATEITGDPTTWKLVGWVFYNAHLVTTRITVDVPVIGGSSAVNFVGGDGFSVLLYAVPPLLLLAAGLFAGQWADVRSAGAAVRAGLTVVAGYLPLAAVGAFAFAVSAGAASGRPTLVTAVGLAGVVYPALFGVLGALVATRT